MDLVNLEPIYRIVHGTNTANHHIKLDLSKAFDRVEWPFLFYTMCRLEFPNHSITLIQHCLHLTKIRVKYNKSKTRYFQPTRGLR